MIPPSFNPTPGVRWTWVGWLLPCMPLGVSRRKAAEVLSLLLGHRDSHETVSALAGGVLQVAGAIRPRPLPEEMAFVDLDGFFLKVLREKG